MVTIIHNLNFTQVIRTDSQSFKLLRDSLIWNLSLCRARSPARWLVVNLSRYLSVGWDRFYKQGRFDTIGGPGRHWIPPPPILCPHRGPPQGPIPEPHLGEEPPNTIKPGPCRRLFGVIPTLIFIIAFPFPPEARPPWMRGPGRSPSSPTPRNGPVCNERDHGLEMALRSGTESDSWLSIFKAMLNHLISVWFRIFNMIGLQI